MNTKNIAAVLLVVAGAVILAYSGISFNTPDKPIDFLGLRFETTRSHFIPPVVGAIALAGGVLLLLLKSRRIDRWKLDR